MAVVVNNPPAENTNSNMGYIVGAIILLLVIVIFFVYGLPAIRSFSAPQVNVPDHMNINVQTQGGSKGH